MPSVTLKKAVELTGKSKRTIQRYMASGKLSYTTNLNGHKSVDVSELLRVFGELSPLNDEEVRPDDTPNITNDRIDKLLAAVERLEGIVDKQSEQIASLLQLEHKPTIEPEAVKPKKAKAAPLEPAIAPKAKLAKVFDYTDDIDFIKRTNEAWSKE